MTHVWIFSLGLDSRPPSPETAARTAAFEMVTAELRSTLPGCSVEKWRPFGSEHDYPGEPRFIVLLVCGWRAFDRQDYFVATGALALHEAGTVHLLSVIDRTADGPNLDANPNPDVWLERYQSLWKRLENIAVIQSSPDPSSEWPKELAAKVKQLAVDSPPAVNMPATQAASVFFSYCHRDDELRDQLTRHLRLLERAGLIQNWHDRKIVAGEEWASAIDAHLYTADLVLLLLSSDFFASDYCSEMEAPVALARHQAGAARAIPIVLRPVVWMYSPLAALQALPTDARPVTSWDSPDAAFVNVSEGILRALLDWKNAKPGAAPQAPPAFASASSVATRKRVVDAAMPAEVEVDRSAMLIVLVRTPASAGLSALLARDAAYGVAPEDVHSQPVSLEFPLDSMHKPTGVTLTVRVKAPDFDPPEQQRPLILQPRGDSQPLIFMLAARREGGLKAVVEVYHDDQLVTACPLSTLAAAATGPKFTPPQVVSAAFDTAEMSPGAAERSVEFSKARGASQESTRAGASYEAPPAPMAAPSPASPTRMPAPRASPPQPVQRSKVSLLPLAIGIACFIALVIFFLLR